MPPALASLPMSKPRFSVAAAWQLADAAGAAMFAFGLALAISALVTHHHLLAGCAIALVAGAWRAFAGAKSQFAGARAARRAKTSLRARALEAVLQMRVGGDSVKGERISAVSDGIEHMDGWFARYEPAEQAARLAPMALLAVIFCISPISGAVLVGAFVPFILLMALAGMTGAAAALRQLDALSKLSGLFVDRVRTLPLILACGAEARETETIASAALDVRARTLAVLGWAFTSSAALEFFAALSVALVAVYIGFNLLHLLPFAVPERLDLFRGVFVLALTPEVFAPLRRLASFYHDKQIGAAAGERLAAVLAAPRIGVSQIALRDQPPTLSLRGAQIAYEDGAVVGPFDFVAPAGQITAITGASGAGKTSVLAALLGLHPLAAGEIWADDAALSSAGSFASISAYAGQTPLILAASIADNIALAAPGSPLHKILACARKAGLGPALARRQLNEVLDERGGGLSGGERRRIGLARALMKEAPLILLDEPTADLDADAEHDIIELIASLKGRATIVIATHSAKLAARADHVVALA